MGGHRVAVVGMASWDHLLLLDRMPEPGGYEVVRSRIEQPGGTGANMATALARLGVEVTLASMVGDDREGKRLRDGLGREGCTIEYIGVRPGEPTDRATILITGTAAEVERTILWEKGARLRRGDVLPISDLFAHDLFILDVDDPELRGFLADLPTHISPRTRVLGTLTYLTGLPPQAGLDLALRHDVLVGNAQEIGYLTGSDNLERSLAVLQERMTTAVTRSAAISVGPAGCVIIDEAELVNVPGFQVAAVDPTGAGDAFAAGIAFAMLIGENAERRGRLANALGALTTTQLGARTALPDRTRLDQFLASNETA